MMTNRIQSSICLAALTLGLAACQNDDFASGSNGLTGVVTLSGTIAGDSQSRAQILLGNADISTEYFLWNEGDSFSLYDLGSDGATIPLTLAKFSISSDYSDESKSSTATFTGECGIDEGNTVAAFYPAQSSVSSDGSVALAISASTAMGGNTESEIVSYLSGNMYMYGTSNYSSSGTSIVFDHLTTMVRISYTNASSSDQTVTAITITGDGSYFGTSASLALVGGSVTVSGKTSEMGLTFDGVTVGVGESAEFYLLFFTGDAFNDGGTLTFTVNEQSVPMETSKILTTEFTTGFRYEFDLQQTDDALEWVNESTGYDYSVGVEYVSQSTEYGNPYVIADVTEIGANLDYVVVSLIEGTDSSSSTSLADVTVTETGQVTLTLSQTPETGTCTIVATGYDDDAAVSIGTVSFEYTAPSADYSLGLSYVGQSEDYNNQYVTAELTSIGSQVESVRLALFTDSISAEAAALAISSGEVSYQEVTSTGTVTFTLDSSYESGAYTIVAVAYDGGVAAASTSVTFDYTAPGADYSLGVTYVSQSTEYGNAYIIADVTEIGEHIGSVRMAVVSGSSASESDISSIVSGELGVSVSGTGEVTYSLSTSTASGTYTVVVVGITDGVAVVTATATFDYDAPQADYSLGVTYVSQSTEYGNEYVIATVTEFGANLSSVRVALVSGSSVSDSDIAAITDGTVTYKQVTATGQVKFTLDSSYASGTYTVVAVGYSDGEAVTSSTATFSYTAPVRHTTNTGSDFSSGGSI